MTPPATESPVKSLDEILAASAAAETFKDAARKLASGTPQTVIRFNPGAPPVKVLRVVMKLLEENPVIAFEGLFVEGDSGCSNFNGRAMAQPGNISYDFNWDCLWKAGQQGWTDAFGDPDQIRAARTFGYQCFREFVRTS